MKKIILVGALAMLAACSSTSGGSSGNAADNTAEGDSSATSIDGSDDTITVDDFGQMPPKCIDLLGAFLKKIEPTVSKIDWDKATLADFEGIGTQFQADSDSFDAQMTAAGCDKYNLSGSDESQFEQIEQLAAVAAPGTVEFMKFLSSLSSAATATGGSIPADCDGTIAAIEPYLAKGTSMKDLTMAELTQLSQLMTGVSTNCTSDEASAFYAREDVTAFVSG